MVGKPKCDMTTLKAVESNVNLDKKETVGSDVKIFKNIVESTLDFYRRIIII